MNEKEVLNFWNAHPCDEALVGGIKDDYEAFFNRYDKFRYKRHYHLLRCLDEIDFDNKRVLDIGFGLGADSEQLIRRGAIWNGLDLTPASVERVTRRMSLRNLSYEQIKIGSACNIPYESNSFDIIYSHGVLHHIPDIDKAQSEIARVLKPGGQLIMMLYAKHSLNYWLSIFFLRRLVLMLIYITWIKPKGISGQHIENARKMGIFKYLSMKNFIHRNTDGPLNPYSKVYSLKDVRNDFSDFKIQKSHKEFMWAPPLPASKLPFAHIMGWHLWVTMSLKSEVLSEIQSL